MVLLSEIPKTNYLKVNHCHNKRWYVASIRTFMTLIQAEMAQLVNRHLLALVSITWHQACYCCNRWIGFSCGNLLQDAVNKPAGLKRHRRPNKWVSAGRGSESLRVAQRSSEVQIPTYLTELKLLLWYPRAQKILLRFYGLFWSWTCFSASPPRVLTRHRRVPPTGGVADARQSLRHK